MAFLFRIKGGTNEILGGREMPDSTEYVDATLGQSNGKDYFVPVDITDPPYDPETEIKEGPVDTYTGVGNATRVFTVRPKTQAELDQEDNKKALQYVSFATKDIGIVLTTLIDTLIAQNIITAQDVEPIARQAYQNLKTRVDRIKGT